MGNILALDIGGTTIKYGVVSPQGQVLRADKVASFDDQAALYQTIRELLTAHADLAIDRLGISVPGIVRSDGSMQTAGAIKSLYGVPLQAELTAALGLPVRVENDANCAGLAEHWLGASATSHNSLLVTVGTGIGGAIIVDDRLLRGAFNRGGEIGFMLVEPPEPDDSKSMTLSKLGAVPSLYEDYYILAHRRLEDGRQLYALAAAGDVYARRAIARFTRKLATGLFNLSVAVDPQVIVIGGAISTNEQFIADLDAAFQALYRANDELETVQRAQVVPAQFRNDAGIIGAAALFRH